MTGADKTPGYLAAAGVRLVPVGDVDGGRSKRVPGYVVELAGTRMSEPLTWRRAVLWARSVVKDTSSD